MRSDGYEPTRDQFNSDTGFQMMKQFAVNFLRVTVFISAILLGLGALVFLFLGPFAATLHLASERSGWFALLFIPSLAWAITLGGFLDQFDIDHYPRLRALLIAIAKKLDM
jgi:hypothetical protein